jgi:hypothetical protein
MVRYLHQISWAATRIERLQNPMRSNWSTRTGATMIRFANLTQPVDGPCWHSGNISARNLFHVFLPSSLGSLQHTRVALSWTSLSNTKHHKAPQCWKSKTQYTLSQIFKSHVVLHLHEPCVSSACLSLWWEKNSIQRRLLEAITCQCLQMELFSIVVWNIICCIRDG